jgi:hypothetical protein
MELLKEKCKAGTSWPRAMREIRPEGVGRAKRANQLTTKIINVRLAGSPHPPFAATDIPQGKPACLCAYTILSPSLHTRTPNLDHGRTDQWERCQEAGRQSRVHERLQGRQTRLKTDRSQDFEPSPSFVFFPFIAPRKDSSLYHAHQVLA